MRTWWSAARSPPLPDGGFDVLVRDGADDDWWTLLTLPADDVAASDVLAFSGDGRSLLAISSIGGDTGRVDPDRPGHRRGRGAAGRPRGGRGGRDAPPGHQDPQIVEALKDRTEYHVLDPSVEPDFKAIRALHSGDPQPVGRDEADTTWLVAFTDDAGPVQYYSYDRTSRACGFRSAAAPSSRATTWPGWSRSVPGEGRADHPRLRHLPAGRGPVRPADRAQRARRAAGPRRLGLGSRGEVAGQPGLPVHSGELPGARPATASRS